MSTNGGWCALGLAAMTALHGLGCGSSTTRSDGGAGADAGNGALDAGVSVDAFVRPDAGFAIDAGFGADAGFALDAGFAPDAGSASDAGHAPVDAHVADAGFTCVGDPPLIWSADDTATESMGRYDFSAPAGPVVYGPGHDGNAWVFSGSNFLEAANVPGGFFDRLTDQITVEAFINIATVPSSARIVDKITAGVLDGMLLDIYPSRLRGIVAADQVFSTATIPTGRWVHVAFTYDGAIARLYVDGALITERPLTGPIQHNTRTLRIGADSDGNNRFTGSIDDVRIHCRALSSDEIGLRGARRL